MGTRRCVNMDFKMVESSPRLYNWPLGFFQCVLLKLWNGWKVLNTTHEPRISRYPKIPTLGYYDSWWAPGGASTPWEIILYTPFVLRLSRNIIKYLLKADNPIRATPFINCAYLMHMRLRSPHRALKATWTPWKVFARTIHTPLPDFQNRSEVYINTFLYINPSQLPHIISLQGFTLNECGYCEWSEDTGWNSGCRADYVELSMHWWERCGGRLISWPQPLSALYPSTANRRRAVIPTSPWGPG